MKTGFTCSCFDLFHLGHVMMLKEAKSVCDYLVVGVQTDPTIDRKEKNEPVQSVFERVEQVRACRYVDEVVVYDTEASLIDVLSTINPDIRIVGAEYDGRDFTGKHLSAETYYNKRNHRFSSTNLRRKVVEAERTVTNDD